MTPDRRTHRSPLPQPYSISRRAGPLGYRLAPPGRLKSASIERVLNKAHLHLGDLLPDPLRIAHLRSGCELLRVVYEERLGAHV